jgi:arylsulfatase/arylsulfatase A
MNNRLNASPLALTIVATVLSAGPPLLAADRPNVVLIMTDDQGYGDFGATGNRLIETPHLDAMAKRSASMSTFYVSPVCSPTRACLMTGRYNYRTRCIDTWVGRSMMEPEEVTVAESLRAAGYATGIFGKWHLGDCYPMRAIDQGFDTAVIHRGGGLAQPSEPRESGRRYTDPILYRNGKPFQSRGYCTDTYFSEAIEFIEQSSQAKKPFFVYLPTNAPHGPFHDVPEKLREALRPKGPDHAGDQSARQESRGRRAGPPRANRGDDHQRGPQCRASASET